MCGIFGIIQPNAPAATLLAHGTQASGLLAHRGPDQSGLEQGQGWLLSHRRLSIYDLSEKGRQPLHYQGLRIIFNGAIYNFPELKRELLNLGYAFRSKTDTEVILAAYQEWGTECFARFNGMWSLAILDEAQQTLVLSRDRIGIKPLYLYQDDGLLAFASEPKALRNTLGQGNELQLEVVSDFLRFGWQDHRPETIWAGIRQFPAGHFAVCSLHQPDTLSYTAYYQLPEQEDYSGEKTTLIQLRSLLEDSVRLRSRSDVGCGLTLSGGVDSSSIASVLGPEHRTYSALFRGTPYDESPYVDAVIDHTGQPNHSLFPAWQDFTMHYQACTIGQDQPLASAAVVIHYRLMQLVKEKGEKVILNGQGADEIGAGYDKFYPPYLREMITKGLFASTKAAVNLVRQWRIAPDKLAGRLQRRLAPTAATSFLAPALRAPTSFRQPLDVDVRTTSLNLLNGMGLPVLLRHEDRSTMAFGIESRPPFLDYRIVALLLQAPADFKLKHGMRKWGIRESVRSLLPKQVYQRKRKLGFATPQHRWLEAHADFFLTGLRQYTRTPGAFLSPQAIPFATRVLARRQTRYYAQIWRWWAWAVFHQID
ncbi:MAG: asparagine synthase (glutamine-hydrolyzing) [Bacteroidota bacterium]